MKNVFLLFILLPTLVMGQNQDTTHYKYAEVVLAMSAMTGRVGTLLEGNYFFDFGDGVVYTPDKPMKDAAGNEVTFAGPAVMMNWMDKQGWQLIQSFATEAFSGKMGSRLLTYYIFRKPRFVKG
jgi:hypothetical protein